MSSSAEPTLSTIRDVLLETFAANDAMNQLLIEHLDPRAWRARPPALEGRGGRTIGAIFAHLHACRLNWLRRSAPHLERPAPLDPHRCTRAQAAAALRRSSEQCEIMLADALSLSPNRRVKRFARDSWMPIWPAGASMFCYMFGHEAHHRGQVLLLAHQLGFRIPPAKAAGIWQWDKLWKQKGFTTRPR
jgi:uncharacterized damage-inducible protein DinB